ncbi:MAG: hypothetical protein Q8N51_13185 [Gammaproteobacteria bacterium]|nr:hypothetical protein [Gammaproteobacteria bacterium]
MKPQHVIYRAGNSVVLYSWDRQRYVPVSGYELPDGDPTPVVDYLRQTPAAVIAILLDVMEEEHTLDRIAQLGRSDQSALLARKLARAFPRTDFRTAAVQGHEPDDPKITRILLSGFTKTSHLTALLGLLDEAQLPVACICSPALLSRPLVDKLRPTNPADATMLVSRHLRGSLRLSFFRGRHLVGTRLMRRSVAASPGDMAHLVKQLDESVRYFDAAFAPSASTPVDVILLCENGIDPAAAMSRGMGHEGYRLHVPDPAAAAKNLGIGDALQPGNADLLFVELLRRFAPSGDFAPTAARRYFHMHRARIFGKAACLALAAAALLGLSLNGVALLETNHQVEDVRHSTAELTHLLQADAYDYGANGADPLEMSRAVTAWRELERHNVDPEAVLRLVSSAMERQPRVLLDAVQWSPVSTAALTTEGAESGNDNPIEPGADETDPGDSNAGASGSPMSRRVRISIQGRVEPFGGNYPLAFAELQSFMNTLRGDPRVLSVSARKEPLDVNPRSTLTGEITPTLRNDQATFTVDLLVRFPDEPA